MSVLLALPLCAVLCAANADEALKAQTDAWHRDRLLRLSAEDGWLTLVDLVWLEEGGNAAPRELGTFLRRGFEVSFFPTKGTKVELEGQRFDGGPLRTDAGGKPQVLRHKTLQMLVIQRGERVGVRVRDSASPARTGFRGIDRFAVQAQWRKRARWEPSPEGATIAMPDVLGEVTSQPLAGAAVFTHEGQEHRLHATLEGEQLFFVFADRTNRDQSYGAGRFLYADLPSDGALILDFNRAYNPPCAFTRFATCPLPPRENRLGIRVEAGEKRYQKP